MSINRIFPPEPVQRDMRLHVVILRESNGEKEMWVAQCLEYDIVTQSHDLKSLFEKFQLIITGHIALALKHQEQPFANLKPAPSQYWTQFTEGFELQFSLPLSIPPDRVSPQIDSPPSRIPRGEVILKMGP